MIVHTSSLVVESLTELFAELGPEVEVRHEIEEGLLDAVIEAGEVTPALRDRLLERFRAAAAGGCDVIFSQCSSVGDVADAAARELGVEIVRIDAPMAEEACRAGGRVGVLATLPTTLAPTRDLLLATAERLGRRVEVETRVVEGAFARLEAGDRAGHDECVLVAARAMLEDVDCLVLAQGSMARVLPRLGDVPVPVLTSPRSGVARAVELARARSVERP